MLATKSIFGIKPILFTFHLSLHIFWNICLTPIGGINCFHISCPSPFGSHFKYSMTFNISHLFIFEIFRKCIPLLSITLSQYLDDLVHGHYVVIPALIPIPPQHVHSTHFPSHPDSVLFSIVTFCRGRIQPTHKTQ